MTTTVAVARTVKGQAVTLAAPVGTAWGLLGVNTLLGGFLTRYGIHPRTLDGLWGILWAPFLHGNYAHLATNTVPFVVLGWLVLTGGRRRYAAVSLFVALTSGVFAWAFSAPNSVTVGASGVIFGYLGYLMLSGWYAKRVVPILLSLGVTAMWGGMVWGVLPGAPGISWQAHLGGLLGGILAARWWRR